MRSGIPTAPLLPRARGPSGPGSGGGGGRATGPAREQSATKARLPRPSPAGSAARSPLPPNQEGPSQPCAATRAGFRGASRPLREAGDPPRDAPTSLSLCDHSPTWRELGPRSTGGHLSPRGTQPSLSCRAGVRSSAHRRDPPATPSSQLRSRGWGGDVARGARREARGARARRGRAAGARRPWSALGLGEGRSERAPTAASASYFLSGFLLEEEKH